MTLSTVVCVCLLGFIRQYLINYVSVRIYTTTSGPQRSSSGSGTKLGQNRHFFHKVGVQAYREIRSRLTLGRRALRVHVFSGSQASRRRNATARRVCRMFTFGRGKRK